MRDLHSDQTLIHYVNEKAPELLNSGPDNWCYQYHCGCGKSNYLWNHCAGFLQKKRMAKSGKAEIKEKGEMHREINAYLL